MVSKITLCLVAVIVALQLYSVEVNANAVQSNTDTKDEKTIETLNKALEDLKSSVDKWIDSAKKSDVVKQTSEALNKFAQEVKTGLDKLSAQQKV